MYAVLLFTIVSHHEQMPMPCLTLHHVFSHVEDCGGRGLVSLDWHTYYCKEYSKIAATLCQTPEYGAVGRAHCGGWLHFVGGNHGMGIGAEGWGRKDPFTEST